MIVNEQIKASEVQLTGIDGEDLGIDPAAKRLRWPSGTTSTWCARP